MGQTKPPVSQAVERGEFALRVFDDAWASGDMDSDERRLCRAALHDWFATTKAAKHSVMVGLAFMKGIQGEAYQDRLVSEYRASIDEVPSYAGD